MLIIFPIIGLILAGLTCFLKSGDAVSAIGYFIAYTVFAVILYLLSLAVLALFVDKTKPNSRFDKFYNRVITFTLKMVVSACGIKLKVEGEELIPENTRFVLIQNHRSGFDPVVTLAALGSREIAFITKPENMNLPVIGQFMHSIRCIPIDRENPRNAVKSINAAAENIKNDICSMAIYPEGTRSKGEEMLSFKNGSLKIATKSGAPLVITTVSNTDKVKKNALRFKKTEVTLKICEVIPAEEVSASTTAELADKAQEIMVKALSD